MFRRTQRLTFGRELQDAILGAMGAAPIAELLDGVKVKLYTDTISPGPTSVPGDFTEPAFTGYAEVALPSPLEGPGNLSESGSRGIHGEVNFECTADPGSPETVQGYFIVNAAEDTLIAAEQFEEPVSFGDAGDFLSLDVIIGIAADQPGE